MSFRSARAATLLLLFVLPWFAADSFRSAARADDWPQWRGPQRDGVWRETGLVDRFSQEQLPIKWRTEVGPGYSGPTVAEGRVYVTDRVTEPEQQERILCLDAESGKSLWMHSYPCRYTISYEAGPRACVTIDEGKAYALGAMGHLHCLDAATGEIAWKRDLNEDYSIEAQRRMPIWGIAAAPLIYEDLVILHLGAKDACLVALDKNTGKQRWTSLDDRASYSAPILIRQGQRDVVVCWTGDSVAGLKPDTGEVYWRVPFAPRNMPIGIATPVVDEGRLFVSSFYDGSLMLDLNDTPGATKDWYRVGENEINTDALHCLISTPVLMGDFIYGVDSYGQLRCLEAGNGDRVWENTTATPPARWSNIHMVQNGERWWMFNERGELIIARLSPQGYEEISRAKLLEPTRWQLNRRGGVCWSHPAFANRHVFIRNDQELVCASLAAE